MRNWISVHDGFGPRVAILEHATDVDRAWVKNDAGAGQFLMPQGDEQVALLGGRFVYVIETDTGLPPWVGYKAPGQVIVEDGDTISLPLRELSNLLATIYTDSDEVYVERAAGGILRDAMSRATVTLPLVIGDTADGGPVMAFTWRNNSLLSVAQQLADGAGYQWWLDYEVTPSRIGMTLRWSSRRGMDLTDSVQLVEGRNLGSVQVSDPDDMLPERVTVIGSTSAGTAYANRPQAYRTAEAILAGPLLDPFSKQAVIIDEHITDGPTAEQRALVALQQRLRVQVRATVTDPALWPSCLIDNDVRLVLPSFGRGQGIDADARITAVQPDEATGELDLLLEVL